MVQPMPSIFESERLLVRPWTLDDAEEAFAIYGDAEVSTFISLTGPESSLEAQRESLARLIARHEGWDPGYGFWAIVEKASGRIVGSVMLKPLPGHAEIDVGWHLGRCAWGHGYATEAGRGAIQYGFDSLGLSRIVAVVNPLNTRSLAVCRRLGMKHEGRIEAYSLELELFSITPAQDGVGAE
jgi:[ribosomal protein S5]-alanine N-acetyltransferase